MLAAKIHIQPFHHVTDVLSHAMEFSRAFADTLGIYATGVSQAHITVLETMRPSSDDRDDIHFFEGHTAVLDAPARHDFQIADLGLGVRASVRFDEPDHDIDAIAA